MAGTVERYFVGVADLLLCRFSVAQLRLVECSNDNDWTAAGEFAQARKATAGLER